MNNYRFSNSVRAFAKDVEETRTIEYVISTSKRDRHNTRVMLDRWDLRDYNGIFGYQHDLYGGGMCTDTENPDKALGPSEVWIEKDFVSASGEKGALIGAGKYEPEEINPLAEKIFRKTLHGTFKSTSVGFAETEKGGFGDGEEKKGGSLQTYYYGRQGLLEWSVVTIPSNTDTDVRSYFRDHTANALRYMKSVLGYELKTDDMLKMQVSDVLNMLKDPLARNILIGGEIIDNEQQQKELGDNLAESILLDHDLMEMDLNN